MVYKSRISAGNLCCTVSQERFLARKMRIRTMLIVPTLFLGVEYCATFQAALYIETHSLMHQSEFHAASVALSRAADKRKSLINIHRNGYTATLRTLAKHIFALSVASPQSTNYEQNLTRPLHFTGFTSEVGRASSPTLVWAVAATHWRKRMQI